MKQIVRIFNTDIEGNKPLYYGLRKVKGIDYSISNAICNLLNVEQNKKIGELTDQEIKKITEIIQKLPPWLMNRKKDFDSGENKHLIYSDVKLRRDFDIKLLKMIKCYRGLRHAAGLPVRGQRTKAHFRRGPAVGVKKTAKMKKTGK